MDQRERQDRLLRGLMKDFADGGMPAELFLQEETSSAVDILRVAVDDFGGDGAAVLVEFCFLELDTGAPDVAYFVSVLTIDEELEEAHLPELFEAIGKLNFYLPAGYFAVNSGRTTLAFKVTTQIPLDDSDEAWLRQMNIAAAHTLEVAESYAALLVGIAHGDNELAEIEMLLP